MFGPTKVSIILDKMTAISGIGFVLAACGCMMLKSSIEHLIHGGQRWTRTKSLVLLGIACGFVTVGIVTILETQVIAEFLSGLVDALMAKLGK